MTMNSNILFAILVLLANSAKAAPAEPPTVKSLIFSLALSYSTLYVESVYSGITATSVDILCSFRSADTPLVAYASEPVSYTHLRAHET